MEILVAEDYGDLSKLASSIISRQIISKPDSVIGFAAGSTPVGLYYELVKNFKSKILDFSKVKAVLVNEYKGLPPEHPNSSNWILDTKLFDHVNIDGNNILRFNGLSPNPQKECQNFNKKLKKIDLQVLVLGMDGQLGFNEPGTSFQSGPRIVNLAKKTQKIYSRYFRKHEMPKKGFTLGMENIHKAKKIVVLASGKRKAHIVKKFLKSEANPEIPATLLKKHKNSVAIIDKDAINGLKLKKMKILKGDNIPKEKKIVVISPHPDDSAASCGGLLSMISKHNNITTVIMCSGDHSEIPNTTKRERRKIRKQEAIKEAKILGTKPLFLNLKFYDKNYKKLRDDERKLIKTLKMLKPDIIFLPSTKDKHPAHKISSELTIRAAKKIKNIELVFYEGLWNMFNKGEFNVVVNVDKKHFKKKLKAIKAHKSQTDRIKIDKAVKSQAMIRSIIVPELITKFGQKSINMGQYLEVYKMKKI